MTFVQNPAAPPSDLELVLQFESIGDNCELGLVQRRAGAEPLGLLRFAGAPLHALLGALKARFEGIADAKYIRVEQENDEYMVKLTKYDLTYHAHIKAGEMTPEAVHRQQTRTIGFLADKFIQDLKNPAKILVFRQNEPLSAGDLVDLRVAVSAYGPGILLWVQAACPRHPPGTVDVADERLFVGYVRRLAERDDVPNLDTESWMAVLRRAYALSLLPGPERGLAARKANAGLGRTELTFGLDGNAQSSLGYGWSDPEPGYQWSTGQRSLVTLDNPGVAGAYWLEMWVKPYISPPLLPFQRMDVRVNGTLVHRLGAVSVGEFGFCVPAELIAGRPQVEIILEHPDAACPMLISGGGDDRHLAVSFTRLALICAPLGTPA